jgi:hypothetical protein
MISKITESDSFKHVLSSLIICSQAILELRTLSQKYDLEIVNATIRQNPFRFYRGSLSSMITLEYYKLFNPNEKGAALSNITKLWHTAYEKHKELTAYKNNADIIKLENVQDWESLKAIKRLRNKKVAHSDKDDLNIPNNVRVFNEDEIEIISQDLDTAINVFNILSKLGDVTIVEFPHQSSGSNQTRNFIHYTAIARAFHDKNTELAYKQGFQACQQKIVSKEE